MNEVSPSGTVPPQTIRESTSILSASPLLMACCLALGPAVAIGFGRFAYALVLPAMRTDLEITYQQAGTLNTANMVGYLLGALVSTRIGKYFSARTVLITTMAAAVVALLLAGFVHAYSGLLFCRALVGFAASFTFIASTSLAAHLGRNENEKALALGIAITGPGMGSFLAGLVVPFLLVSPSNWPLAWKTLGGIGIVLWLLVFLGTRSLHSPQTAAESRQSESAHISYTALIPTLFSYFLFGLGYIAYMTFIIAFVQSQGASPLIIATVWSALGGAMIASSFVWRRPLARERSGRTLAFMGLGGTVASGLLLVSASLPMLLASAVLFGVTIMPMFTAVTVLIRRFLPPSAWASAISVGTAIFAVGQSLGPIGSGFLSDQFGPQASIIWSMTILFVAAVVAWLQKPAPEI